MFLFDRDGYLKHGLSEDVVRTVVQKYAEQEETNRFLDKCYCGSCETCQIRQKTIQEVISNIEEKALARCKRCGGDKQIRCADAECSICATDLYCRQASSCAACVEVVHYADTSDYCVLPTACERGIVSLPQDIKWSSDVAKVTCNDCKIAMSQPTLAQQIADEEDERIIKILKSMDLGDTDSGCTPSIAPTQKQYHAGGMNCAKCNILNQYVTEGNQLDGSYLCWGCRTGF